MPRLPPVAMLRQMRFRARFCPGVMGCSVTFLQSHSSSSATSWASPVCVPWPISARAIRMTTVSSGLITTQALNSGSAPACACADSMPNGMLKPSASPPPAAAEPTMNLRRDRFVVFLRCLFFMFVLLALYAWDASPAEASTTWMMEPTPLPVPAATWMAARMRW